MSIEQLKKLNNSSEKTEKELKEEAEKKLYFEKNKEALISELETKKELAFLKVLIEKGLISPDLARQIISKEHIDAEIVEEVFEKIDELYEISEDTLPKNLRISKEDYSKALINSDDKQRVIGVLDEAIRVTSDELAWAGSSNLFFSFLTFMHKDLIKAHDHSMDIKDSLEEIDDK